MKALKRRQEIDIQLEPQLKMDNAKRKIQWIKY